MAELVTQSVEEAERETKLADGSISVRLHRPIRALDKTKDELVFREPTARDLVECGTPVRIIEGLDGKNIVDIIDERMQLMMARLSGTPRGSIAIMSVSDALNCYWALASFFIPRPPPT